MSDTLVKALIACGELSDTTEAIRIVETHISWVLLTEQYAYKIKKPVDLGFLDFSTLAKRHFFCQEELRLNQRFSPELYLEVVAFYGSETRPTLTPTGEPIEYAVKMVRFNDDCLLSHQLEQGHMQHRDFALLGKILAQQLPALPPVKQFEFSQTDQLVQRNFTTVRTYLPKTSEREQQLRAIEQWTQQQREALESYLQTRFKAGTIKDCHGDLHLGNIAWDGHQFTLFDCIEFSAPLREHDTLWELGFLLMDLEENEHAEYANTVLNSYLLWSGDYLGLPILRYAQCYYAMVRAKVNAIAYHQHRSDSDTAPVLLQKAELYIQQCQSYICPAKPELILMHGLSGSGKSTLAKQRAPHLNAIHLCADVERKRLFGFEPHEATSSGLNSGIYTSKASQETFDHLKKLTQGILRAGWSVILDATFLEYPHRQVFEALADQMGITWYIWSCQAPQDQLQTRISERKGDASEADLSVLQKQRPYLQPFKAHEQAQVVSIDTTKPFVLT